MSYKVPVELIEPAAAAESAVGLPAGAMVRSLNVWRELGNPDEVVVYTIPDEYLQMTYARGELAVLARTAAANGAKELLRWLAQTVDPLDDAYFAATTPDREHYSWGVSNYFDSWARRLPRNELLAESFRQRAPVMTANRGHRVVCSGGGTNLDIAAQYAALGASQTDTDSQTGTDTLDELLNVWEQVSGQPSSSPENLGEATQARTRISELLSLADQRGYVDLVNEVVNSLDVHDDAFRSQTSPIIHEEVTGGLASWWTRRA